MGLLKYKKSFIQTKTLMKQALYHKYGNVEVIKIEDTDIPKPKKNEVLVKVKAAALNPKDILIRKGKFKNLSFSKLPLSVGYDFAGIIEEPNNSSFQKGEQVFGMINGWDGRCCAEYVNVHQNELYKMPENISFEDASGIPLAAQTALQSISDLGKLQKGQKICINGASGGVGTLAIQIAKDFGGIITTISSGKNMEFCKSLGADRTFDYTQTNILETDQKFDIFYDVFGNYSLRKVSSILNPAGIYITTVPKPEIVIEQLWNLFRKKKAKLVVVKSKAEDLKYLYDRISQNKIRPVTDKIYPLAEIKEAQQYIESKRAKGKVIIKINS